MSRKFVEVIKPMIEAPFCFIKIREKGMRANPAQPCQSGLGVNSKLFDSIDILASYISYGLVSCSHLCFFVCLNYFTDKIK